MPPWLAPYPGAQGMQADNSPEVAAIRYTAGAAPADIVAHLRKLFDAAGLTFAPNPDGIGTSIRASLPDCDLLIQIREEASGSSVRETCAVKSANTPSSNSEIAALPVTNRGTSAPAWRPRTIEEARRIQDEHTRQVLADAEAAHQRRISDMSRFDDPVHASSAASSFYNQDAPPLEWPSWLVQEGTNQPPKPVAGTADGRRHLETRYKTTLPMTRLYQFYESLFKANGLQIGTAKLQTGQTIEGHMVQNAWGFVEAYHSMDGTVNGPSIHVKASFNRNYLNEPITVTLRFSVSGSFGRR